MRIEFTEDGDLYDPDTFDIVTVDDVNAEFERIKSEFAKERERVCLWTVNIDGSRSFGCGGSSYADMLEWTPKHCPECGGKVEVRDASAD